MHRKAQHGLGGALHHVEVELSVAQGAGSIVEGPRGLAARRVAPRPGGLDFRLALGSSTSAALSREPALGAFGQDPGDNDAEPASDSGWQIDAQPYIWIPASIKGDSTVSGSTAKLDLTFGDIIDDFDKIFALSGRLEAWKGDWGIIFDGMYVSLESEFNVNPFGGGPRELDIDVDIEQSIVDFGLGWRAIDRPFDEAASEGPRLRIDLLGGLRYQYLKQRIDLAPVSLGTSKDWVELMIGARVEVQLNEKLAVGVRADASGFGIGSASDLTWNLYAGIDYRFKSSFSLKLGYRLLDMDYDNGSGRDEFGLDVRLHGPYIGATFRF